MEPRSILVMALIGFVAGFLASIIAGGGGGLLRYLLVGLIGSFVGGWLLTTAGITLGFKHRLVSEIVTATIGAVVVILLARLIA